ncbi:MAG: MBL fold metallo-hydrolase [Rhodocyclaceae bacterium]
MIERVTEYGDGIFAIDTGLLRPGFDASYLVVEQGRAAFIDTGTAYAVPFLLYALAEQGLQASQVDWVILTHVHLDHAGGAGALLQHLPNARLVVHPRGARHMIDPSALVAGASAVYGEQAMQDTYGTLVPVPAERVVEAADGHVVDMAGRTLLCLDTPGHARHHLSVFDARSQSFFAGDTFGISYRDTDGPQGAFIIPTSSPVQFEPDALRASIERLCAYLPQAMFLTHYGRVADVPARAADLIDQIAAMVAIVHELGERPERHAELAQRLQAYYLARAAHYGCPLPAARVAELLAMDIELNAQGLAVWWDRQQKTA